MINWRISPFTDFTVIELYQYLALRSEVFVVEQNCPYQDLDGLDTQALHLIAWNNEIPLACCRIFEPGVVYNEASIGRVISKQSHRSSGLGKELMIRAVEYCDKHFNNAPIKIGAQAYLEHFYGSFGFERVSDIYLEDDIPHIKMLRATTAQSVTSQSNI